MRRKVRNICLQSVLRQRVRTLFLLLLVGLISFAFISRAVEYLVVDRETDRLANYYRAIGILEPKNPALLTSTTWDGLIELQENSKGNKIGKGAELVSKSRFVAFEDRRRSCSGVLQGIHNSDLDGTGWNHPREVLFYGKLSNKSVTYIEYQFFVEVDQVLAGYPEYLQGGSSIRLRYHAENPGDLDAVYQSLQVGERYLFKAYYSAYHSHGNWRQAPDNLFLSPLTDSGLWFLPVGPEATVDLTDPALAEVAEGFKVLEENQHAMWVIGTKDMSAIPYMQESSRQYYLADGRWLNSDDDLRGNRVCVVHRDFAELRGLSVGDTLTLKLRDLSIPFHGYIIPGEDWDVWQEYETHTLEFEIVGLYGRLDTVPSIFSTRMYIPDSSMPAGYGDSWWQWYICSINSTFYSFILRSPGDAEAFLAENQETLADLGLRVTVLDTGWKNFQASAIPMKRSAAVSAGVFTLVLVLAMALAAFLYLRQRRRDFAILRSLGLPQRDAFMQLLQPMALVGAVSILMGGLVAWFYALGKATETLASLQGLEGAGPSGALSPVWLAGLFAAAFAVLMLFTAVGTVLTARSPVLELLQGAARQGGGKSKPEAGKVPKQQKPVARELHSAPAGPTLTLRQAPAHVRKPGIAQISRYVLRHTRRAPLKSILTVAVALCFTLALGWMSWTMERNEADLDRLYRTTPVEAVIIQASSSSYYPGGFIRRSTVGAIEMSGFVQSAYLEGASIAPQVSSVGEGGNQLTEKDVPLRAFDRPEQFFATTGGDIAVEYADGWDESLFAKDWTEEQEMPVLLPVDMMARFRLQLGDEILISKRNSHIVESYIVSGQYTGTIKSTSHTKPILLPLSALEQLEGDKMLYIAAEFVLDPAKNRELSVFRTRMESLFKTDVGTVPLTFLFWDEELTQVVEPLEKNLQLMEILFPVTVAVSVLIAAGLAALLMFQAAREASIMRVLGTTKGRARAMLCGEQLFLCLVGLLLGLALLILLQRDAAAVLTGPALVCAALYLAGVICGSIPSAVSVTNRMPLELLQVKE